MLPRWPRKIQLTGFEHVEAGLAAGKGVILWVQPCVASTLVVKQALFDAGFPLAHLSRPAHGFSPHPFGQRFVNPILRRAETRFLSERIVIDDEHTIRPLRRLKALLAENRVVSITVTASASRVSEFQFLGGTLTLPQGPVELARSSGALLLPVFTIGSLPNPEVRIAPPLNVEATGTAGVNTVLQSVVRWLAEMIELHPLDWIGWRAGLFVRTSNAGIDGLNSLG